MITVIHQDVQLNSNRYNNSVLMGVQTTTKFVEKTRVIGMSFNIKSITEYLRNVIN